MRAFALTLLLVSLTGCSDDKVPARLSVAHRRFLVTPFAEGTGRPGDSDLGRKVALAISARIAREMPEGTALIDFRDVASRLPASGPVDWLRFGKDAGVDLVLVGTISSWRLKDPKTVGLRRGSMAVEYRVLDVATGQVLLLEPGRTISFPPDRSRTDPGFNYGTDAFTEPEEILQGLIRQAGMEIGVDFLDQEPS